MAERTGELLGRYRLIRKIGTGGFAEVYLGEHIHLKRMDAIKLLTHLSAGDMQNFREEARVIANLQHAHIIRVLDFDIEQGMPYLVMEYAPNGTLRRRHLKGTKVDLLQIVTYVNQLASALQYAHTQRLIHRDVKPDNILLGRNNELLLGDFGAALATRTSLLLNPQNIIGTAAYMAPEQLLGKAVVASDQYALAVVVYEWLCGNCPFEGSALEIQQQQLYRQPPSLLARMPALSPLLERVVMKALSKEPEQRFASIQKFAEAFEHASQHRQVSSSPLFLRGYDGGFVNGQATGSLVVQATPPSLPVIPPTQAIPPTWPQIAPTQAAAQQQPVTVMASPPYTPPLAAKPRRSRRGFIIFGAVVLAATVVGGVAVVEVANAEKSPPKIPATPVPLRSNTVYEYREHRNEVFTAAWSPDSQYIASAGGYASTDPAIARTGDVGVHVWRAIDGSDMYKYTGHTKLVRMVAWNHNGSRIASASEDETVQVWNAKDGSGAALYTGHTGVVMAVSWSPDGTQIASVGVDGMVHIWDANSRNDIISPSDQGQALLAVAWSPDGKYVAAATGKDPNGNDSSRDEMYKVNILDPLTGTILQTFPHPAQVGCLAWSRDSRYIMSGDYNNDDSVRIWDIGTGKNTHVYAGTLEDQIYAVAWSPDKQYIAAGDQNNQVRVWKLAAKGSREILTYSEHSQPIMSVQWSPNGKYIASAGFDKTVQVWQMV